MTIPDLLVIGHICHDKIPGGYAPGGAVAYAGLLGSRLGYVSCGLTSFGPDFLFSADFEEMNLEVVSSECTTVFENIYPGGERTQYLHKKATDLSPVHLPAAWKKAKVVLLCPIAGEVSFDFLDIFENATLCVCPQGWMRQWCASGQVSPKPLDNWERLAKAAIISMSETDVACDWKLIEQIGEMANLLVVTQGAKGATIFQKGKRQHFPSFPAKEVDPTGAGDVFAATFSLKYAETGEVEKAAAFAHSTASFVVEGKGMTSIPSREGAGHRFQKYSEALADKKLSA